MLKTVLDELNLITMVSETKNYYLFKRTKISIKVNGWLVDSFYKSKKINTQERIEVIYNSQYALFVAFAIAYDKLDEKYFFTLALNAEGNKPLIVLCDRNNKSKILFQKVANDKYDAVFSAFIFMLGQKVRR